MTVQTNSSALIIPLAPLDHQQARKFWQKHRNPIKAKQVYLNTLAVCAVRAYLRALDMETNFETSDSWDISLQTLSDTADLTIAGYGKIECRPVLPDASTCRIPFEVREDRLGYIPVQFNPELSEAKLLGFTAKLEGDREDFPLASFPPLELLWDYLQPLPVEIPPLRDATIVCLSRWLEEAIDAGWETIESILGSPPTLATNFRRGSLSHQNTPVNKNGIKRGKLFDLERADERIALFVGFQQPYPDREWDISIEVASIGTQPHLPEDLQLFLLDEKGRSIMQAEARSSEGLEFHFSGELGERFSIKIVLGEVSVTECFLI
ncbi:MULTISPECIES: DUF1822 family protein [Spirulina sp. CCY15215]|uniref:DUF1822 family protein n=1 Tax=Spirulina sp. CCY15215 TaxID=2767591 RepID=UPI001950821D|nr:DUF1822 family protein [Spirulina major]